MLSQLSGQLPLQLSDNLKYLICRTSALGRKQTLRLSGWSGVETARRSMLGGAYAD
jgi:hypothetical protein